MRVPPQVSDCLIDWSKWNESTEVYVDTHNKIASILIPKSGTTYIWGFNDQNEISNRFVDLDHKGHATYRANLPGSMNILSKIGAITNHLSDYQFFEVIREPISRFVSGMAQSMSMFYQSRSRLDSYTDSEITEFLDRVPIEVFLERHYQGPPEYADLCINISGNTHLMRQSWFIKQLPRHPDDVVWFLLDQDFSDNFYSWHTTNNFKKFGNHFYEMPNSHHSTPQKTNDNFYAVRHSMYNIFLEYVEIPRVISALENIYQSDFELWENTKKIAYKA